MTDLTHEQLADFRRRLQAAQIAAKAVLHQGAGHKQVEASGQTIGRLTRMDALQLQAMSQLSRHQIQIKLRQIDAALLMLDAGKFGVCRKCRFPLAFERLDAVPEAPFCMDCQQSMEDS